MSVCAGASYRLKELNNLFIEMTSKNCNQRCKSCFIDFPTSKNIKDYISIDTIKECISDTKDENIYCIYLTGAEPMTHPDFNSILRLCLKRCNVCICTNGTFLNEKKIRFLKKVEDEGDNQIFFKLTLTHYDESENDKARFRGNFRQIIHALKTLSGYNFNSVLGVQNWYNLNKSEIQNHFQEIFSNQGIGNTELQIFSSYPCNNDSFFTSTNAMPDCILGRVISENGVYSCPFLANDYRGLCGGSFKNYSKMINAETDFCLTCAQNINPIHSIG